MDPTSEKGPPLCFSWLTPLLHLGPKRRLEESDMFGVLPEDRSETLGKELQRLWDQEVRRATKESEKPKLSRVLIKCYGKSYAVAGLFHMEHSFVLYLNKLVWERSLDFDLCTTL
uniref:Uncharacterized protein n=1 Tax=Stegastes partitus TaxID=144197 RepID=A0A3B4ZC31_9TELE